MPRQLEAMKDVVACDKLRGGSKQPLIRRFPNGATQYHEVVLPARGQTRRTETSKYPEEEKTIVIPKVAASEMGTAQTSVVSAILGL